MANEPSPIVRQLAAEISGEINEDGALCVGTTERPICVQGWENGKLLLSSQHPLYAITRGSGRRVSAKTEGDDAGWYYAVVSPKDLPTALELALGPPDPGTTPLQFAYECILRDHCAQNLSRLEQGLTLYQNGGVQGVEFRAGSRFIDLLAVDATGNPVVLEFKLSRGHAHVLGQILEYMEWIRQNPPEGISHEKRVRGIIVAKHISNDLRLGAYSQSDVLLVEYSLSVTFTPQERERYAGESRHWDTQGFDDPSSFMPNPRLQTGGDCEAKPAE